MFPQLRKLEKKFSNELAVVGVHSAKFPNEKDADNLVKAVQRYELEHPVINDADFQVWQQYACRAWPTLMFIDPQGKVIGKHEGELPYEDFDNLLSQMVAEFDTEGLLDHKALNLVPDRRQDTALMFPGKVVADAASDRLYISDSNHNRIVITSLNGVVKEVAGCGDEGFADGGFANAAIDHPQGMVLVEDILYVADAENHAIRKLDLAAKTVETIAGTGEQGFNREGREPGRTMPLSSPWDLAFHEGTLYIAMAGIHQLWSLDLSDGTVGPYAGTGGESITDGFLAAATLAQPSGITTDGQKLYFADSETSSIRGADLDPAGKVRTVVGLDLFVFGDVDGTTHNVRLQHPIGITHFDGTLYVADTYNHKIKKVLPVTRGAFTLLGTGASGHLDGPGNQAQFCEPSGLSIADGKIYIADTNNHAIRVADLDGSEVTTLEITGL
ncbi:MAG: alkyl hydroperoxide reductase [SAR202 cluster bacterium Io17-Chloro-G4]|nr:MAG: alkyl hydroperoxide reductase [SAR202 cluster bacterium Io17-Chloro-G4]